MANIDDIRLDIGDDDGTPPSGSITAQHNLLSSTHPDTTAASPTNGALIRGVGGSWTHFPVGNNGEVLTVTGGLPVWASGTPGPSGVAGPSGAPGPSGAIGPAGPPGSGVVGGTILHWGNEDIGTTTTTRYLAPGYSESAARTSPIRFVLPRSGILRNMHVVQEGATGNGNNVVYTARINGASTSLSVAIPSTSISGVDNVNQINIFVPSLIDIEITKASGIGSNPGPITLSLEFV